MLKILKDFAERQRWDVIWLIVLAVWFLFGITGCVVIAAWHLPAWVAYTIGPPVGGMAFFWWWKSNE